MYENFDRSAKRAVAGAQDEAMELGHDFIGTEHLLLGVLADDEAVAVTVLSGLGVQREELRTRVLARFASQDS